MASGFEVYLRGPLEDLVGAVAKVSESKLKRYAVVGGLAVIARLGNAHRATTDVDMVYDEIDEPDDVRLLFGVPPGEPSETGERRVRLNRTDVEFIGVQPLDENDLSGLTEMQTLFVLSHSWALETATELTVVAGAEKNVSATAPFATPAALFAMKLHAIQDRKNNRPEKRSSDVRDIHRLLVDIDQASDGADAVRCRVLLVLERAASEHPDVIGEVAVVGHGVEHLSIGAVDVCEIVNSIIARAPGAR